MKGAFQVNSVFAGRFRIEKVLGRGGMGIVYRARHEVLGRVSAVKVLHQSLLCDPTVLARFEREARACSRVEHPCISKILDFGYSDEGIPYLVMEFIDGISLDKLLKQGGISACRAQALVHQIAQALVCIHGAGVIHRDLKPSNVMLLSEDTTDCVKVCDFGLAKIITDGDTALSSKGLVFGTPEYMSPEHCGGQVVDQRGDIYSLGAIAFALLHGKPPFAGSRHRVMSDHLTKTPPTLSPDLPPPLAEMIRRCLEKDPLRRYQSAEDLLRDLGR